MSGHVFVVGDCHGHIERLLALLVKAGFLDSEGRPTDQTRIANVVQLGDLGHYGVDTQEGDAACWEFACQHSWFRVLWGNHDMAVAAGRRHAFRGYVEPSQSVKDMMQQKAPQFATTAHGYLLTHAGLHPSYVPLTAKDALDGKVDRAKFMAALINLTCEGATFNVPVRDDISVRRRGWEAQGGILWRDAYEQLSDIPQVFGHSRAYNVRKIGASFCIDIAAKDDDMLAGIWLPSMQVVAVGADASDVEAEHRDAVHGYD